MTSTELASASDQTEHWVACNKMESSGLFEQCEDVKVIKRAGTRARTYSLPRKKLLNLKLDQVLKIRQFSPNEYLASGEPVLIPAPLIWSSSTSGYQTLCHLEEALQKAQTKVRCGQEVRTVSRKALLKVVESMKSGLELRVPRTSAEKSITQKSSLPH